MTLGKTVSLLLKQTTNNPNKIIKETIKDNLNPNFAKSFIIDYMFEMKQVLTIEILDDDGKGNFDFLGKGTAQLGAVVGAKN